MNITDVLSKDCILLNASPESKDEAINKMAAALAHAGVISDMHAFLTDVTAREQTASTAIGMEICTPHAKSRGVTRPAVCAMVCPDGVDCDSPDGKSVRLFFLLASPENGADEHLDILSAIMSKLADEYIREALIQQKTADGFLSVLTSESEEKQQNDGKASILAVTACPTGIAHTFMAAKALEDAAKSAGISFKCETNGSGGAKNILTDAEIAAAKAIIVAADKRVECGRFNGKRVLFVPVGDGIRRPAELLREALEAPIYRSDERAASGGNRSGAYKHLMNGVSRMLPFVIGGGIMTAIAFMIDAASGAADANSGFGSVTTAAAFFKCAGDLVFSFMLPVLAGYIAQSIAGFPGLVAGAAGASMATAGFSFIGNGGTSGGFIGALAAGFLAGYITLALIKLLASLPASLAGVRDILILPVSSCITVSAIVALINPVFSWINDSLYSGLNSLAQSGNIILLCAILGGMMSIDMGGPFNKAAYTFATVTLSAQTNVAFMIMASVMAGGMIPPLAVALSTTFAPSRWSDEERKGGAANYIMGLSFISEGAIPYATADPVRVIPSCVIGSASAGALSAFFGCTLRAPHGGIFVLPTIGDFGMYAVAITVGSVVGALLLTLFKPSQKKEK